MERKIIYEPHPVLPERKAELRAMGFVIIDAIYAPKEPAAPAPEAAANAPLTEPIAAPELKRDPFDHDGDGRPGGSLPKAKRGRKAK